MNKFSLPFKSLGLFLLNILLFKSALAQVTHDSLREIRLVPVFADKDTSFARQAWDLKASFDSRGRALQYLQDLPSKLHRNGYLSASVDSVWETPGLVFVRLFTGSRIFWAEPDVREIGRAHV